MGLYKRKDSPVWWMSFRHKGRRRFESTGTKNRKLAERIHAKKLTEILEGKWFNEKKAEPVSMDELLTRYEKKISPLLSPTTHDRNQQMIKNLRGFFGKYQVSEMCAPVVSRYKEKMLGEEYSKETIVRELGLLRRIFNIAIHEWEVCETNPVPRVLRTLGKVDNKRVRYLDPEEVQKLMVALPTWLRSIVMVTRHTGLRRSNILNLTWDQVDLSRKVIIIGKTKNLEPLGIPLTETVCKVLAEQGKVRHLNSPYVFCDESGAPYDLCRVSVAFRRARKKAGIENLRFHDLRHDFASSLVQAGVDIYRVKDLLGHKDLRMTVRYSHLAPENLRDAIKVLDEKTSGYDLVTPKEKGLQRVP